MVVVSVEDGSPVGGSVDDGKGERLAMAREGLVVVGPKTRS